MFTKLRNYLYATGYAHFNKFAIPVFITLGVSLLEILGVGLIYPILQIFLDKRAFEQSNLFALMNRVSIQVTTHEASLCLLAVFLCVTLFRGWFTYHGFKRIFSQLSSDESEFAIVQFRKLLAKEYLYFVNSTSIQIIRDIAIAIPQGFSTTLQSAFLFLSEALVLIGICFALLLTNYQAFIILTLIFMFSVLVYVKLLGPKIRALGMERHEHSHKTIGILQQSIEGIQQIKNCQCENYFVRLFSEKRSVQGKVSADLQLVQTLPKIYFETIMVLCVCMFISYKVILVHDDMNFIIVAGFYVVAALRLLPSVLRMSAQYNNIVSFNAASEVIVKLHQDTLTTKHSCTDVHFINKIIIKDLDFRYTNEHILQKLDLTIHKRECIGIFGMSGQGKTTLVNVLVGLLHSDTAMISIDDKPASRAIAESCLGAMIAYVPQNIFLIDDTIRRNVAFGKEDHEIDDARVLQALIAAALMDFVEKCADGINTYVGERGARISGGQRQRLGIARALYTNRDIIVFDEATASLDFETEDRICDTISQLKESKTVIIISHRKKPLTICDNIYQMEGGRLIPVAINNVAIGN